MSDLKNLFELALADDADGTTVHGEVATDPSADLARGKRLLARRRHRRMLGGAAIGAVAAVTVAAVAVAPNAGGGKPSLANTASGAGRHPAATIRLVAYTGAQPPGYTVAVIPAGWVVQGSTPYALVIAPANAPSKDPDVFIGKLFVGQESFDPSGASAQGWSPAHIPGHTAYYSVQNAGGTQTASLVIEVTATDWLVIQAPTSLGWTEQQMIQFGLGVKILSTAQEGKG